MEKLIEKQVKRFVELSLEFTVSSDEVYEGFSPGHSGLVFSGNGVCFSGTGYINVTSKLEQYKLKLEEDATRAERYEEFITLQGDLKNYFDSLEKLNLHNQK